MVDYIGWDAIESALDGLPLDWDEEKLVRVGKQKNSPLQWVRTGLRASKPIWRRDDVISFFHGRLRKQAPELAQEIELRLSAPRTAAQKKPTKSRAS